MDGLGWDGYAAHGRGGVGCCSGRRWASDRGHVGRVQSTRPCRLCRLRSLVLRRAVVAGVLLLVVWLVFGANAVLGRVSKPATGWRVFFFFWRGKAGGVGSQWYALQGKGNVAACRSGRLVCVLSLFLVSESEVRRVPQRTRDSSSALRAIGPRWCGVCGLVWSSGDWSGRLGLASNRIPNQRTAP